jgi:hypothetical protein
MQDAGFLKSDPNSIVAKGTDWRILDDLKRAS